MPQRTPSDDAWMALKPDKARARRPTEGLPRVPTLPAQWRQMPVTVGLLIAGVYAMIFLASTINGYYSDMDARIAKAIAAHDLNATCHNHLEADQAAAMAHVHERLRKLSDAVETLKEKHRTVTGRRR